MRNTHCVQHPPLSSCSLICDPFLLFLWILLRPLPFPDWATQCAVIRASLSQAPASDLGECLPSQCIYYLPVYPLFLSFIPSSVFKLSFCCCYCFLFLFIICLRQGLYYEALAVPELARQTSLDSNSHASTCLCLVLGVKARTILIWRKSLTQHSHIEDSCEADSLPNVFVCPVISLLILSHLFGSGFIFSMPFLSEHSDQALPLPAASIVSWGLFVCFVCVQTFFFLFLLCSETTST